MPPIVGALVTAALTAEIGATAASIVGAVISAALSFVAQALLTPPAQSAQRQRPERQPIENKVTIRQPAGARPIVYGNTRVGGTYAQIYSANSNQYLYLAVMLAGHQIQSIDEIWFDNTRLTFDGSGNCTGGTVVGTGATDNRFANLARITTYLGSPTQQADPNWLSEIPQVWDASCRLQGIPYLAVRLTWDSKAYYAGIPNITAVVHGKNDIYDPRTATTGYSSNPALCLVNYLCDPTYGVPASYASAIDEPALIAAANACDLSVSGGPSTGAGTEMLFSADGASLSSDTPQTIIGNLLGAMHGKVAYDGNIWRVLAGVYQTPDNSFTDDILRTSPRGPKIQTLTSRRDLFNCVKGTYTGPDQNWQQGDFPPLVSQPYITADGGLQVWKDLTLVYCNSATRAQRIATIDLLKARWQIVATMPCKLSAWACRAGDTIYWTSARYGWVNKPFEVAEAKLTFERGKDGPQLGVDLTLLETDPSIYNPSSSILVVPAASAHTSFPNAINVLPPSNLAVGEQLYTSRDGGGVKNRAILTWNASPDAFVLSGGGYLPQYRLHGSSSWISLPQTSSATASVNDIAPGTYDFQVSSVNWAGNLSTPIGITSAIVGLNAPPVTPQNFSVNAIGGAALLRWSLPTDLDVLQGGFMVVRFSSLTSGATWDQAVSIGEAMAANAMAGVLPLKTGTYLAKFQNSNGIYSTAAATFVSNQTSMWSFTALASIIEQSSFLGVMTGTALDLDDNCLKLDSASSFDSVSSVDSLPSFDYPGGVNPSGTYAFHAPLDLGSAQLCRLTSILSTQVYDVTDEFDLRPGDIDDWSTWDGNITGEECDALLTVQSTQTNPSASPTWSNSQRLDSAEFSARGFQFLLTLLSADGNYNVKVSTLEALAEAP